jgi:hypothetical protein
MLIKEEEKKMEEHGEIDNNITKEGNLIFWNGDGRIIPHLLYEFFFKNGIGKYYPDDTRWKNTDPLIVKIKGNLVSEVNVAYLLETARNYICEYCNDEGERGPIIDSLHKSISLFGDKNLKLLPTMELQFISDTRNNGYFYFRNGILQVTAEDISIHEYKEFNQYVWENSIIDIDFKPVTIENLAKNCDFNKFLVDITKVDDSLYAEKRLKSLKSAVGYLLHRYKDGNTNKAIILMDVYVNGKPNGGSGKTLLIYSIGKMRNLAIIDGKKYDQREWFSLSSVGLDSEILLFDDVVKDFNFEQIFPLTSGGMYIRRKYKDHIHIPHEESPKIAITTNYAINGDSSSHTRRKYEIELSPTYSADYSPRDKFGRNFFDDWFEDDWNLFYNTMIRCLQIYLQQGLIEAEPINLRLNKLVNNTCEEFLEFGTHRIEIDKQLNKKQLYDDFINAYPEFNYQIKQRMFTEWLREWGIYKNLSTMEGHTGNIRYIIFSDNSTN